MGKQERDASVERLLRQAMQRDARPSGPCLDADTFAAWSEGTLSGNAQSAAESHVASCSRCQAVLAAMARTAHVGLEADTSQAHASALIRGMRWIVPLAGAAAAAALVLAIWPDSPLSDREADKAPAELTRPKDSAEPGAKTGVDEIAAAPKTDAEETAARAKAATGVTPSRTLAAPTSREGERLEDERRTLEKKVTTDSLSRGRRDDAARDQSAMKPAALSPQGRGQTVPRAVNEGQSLTASQQAQNQNQSPSQNQAQSQLQNQNQGQLQNRQAQAAKSPTPPPPPPAAPAAQSPRPVPAGEQRTEAVRLGGLAGQAIAGAIPAVIATPDSSVMWRLTNARDIQRSDDSGGTWTTQTTVPDVELIAGACPTTTTCWIVGSAGAVLRTTDGRVWQRIPFVEVADLVAVRASDAANAVVTAKDGRTFGTSDGGKTWTTRR